MENTEKIRILTEIKRLLWKGAHFGFCEAYAEIIGKHHSDITEPMLNELGLFKPAIPYDSVYWYRGLDVRIQKIDEALAKLNNNKMSIQEEIKSIEENLAKETERLNKLREQMNKPKTLDEHFKDKNMYYLISGEVDDDDKRYDNSYPTKAIAEKELLRARLIQWAYVLNGGEFVPKYGNGGACLCGTGKQEFQVITDHLWYSNHGQVFFKTRELAEEAMSKFTKDELIKMLS